MTTVDRCMATTSRSTPAWTARVRFPARSRIRSWNRCVACDQASASRKCSSLSTRPTRCSTQALRSSRSCWERRAACTSAIVVPLIWSSRPTYLAATAMSGETTRAPPRAPRRTLIRDSASRIRNASRSVGRDTPNISISTVSDGSESPVLRSPRTTCPRMYDAISSAVLGARRTGPAGSRWGRTRPSLGGVSSPRRWPGAARAGWRTGWLGRVLVLEGQPQLGPEDDVAVLDTQVLLHHLGDAQVTQGLAGGVHRGDRGVLPGLGARADDVDDPVHAHGSLLGWCLS